MVLKSQNTLEKAYSLYTETWWIAAISKTKISVSTFREQPADAIPCFLKDNKSMSLSITSTKTIIHWSGIFSARTCSLQSTVFIYHAPCYCTSHLFLNRLPNTIESISLFTTRNNRPLETGLRNPNSSLLFVKAKCKVTLPPTPSK